MFLVIMDFRGRNGCRGLNGRGHHGCRGRNGRGRHGCHGYHPSQAMFTILQAMFTILRVLTGVLTLKPLKLDWSDNSQGFLLLDLLIRRCFQLLPVCLQLLFFEWKLLSSSSLLSELATHLVVRHDAQLRIATQLSLVTFLCFGTLRAAFDA